MLHRRHPSFPVFSCKWLPWQHTSLSQVVPVSARKAGGHLDGHGVSRLVSHKLKTGSPQLLQECASLLGPILIGHTKMSTGLGFSTFLTFCWPYKQRKSSMIGESRSPGWRLWNHQDHLKSYSDEFVDNENWMRSRHVCRLRSAIRVGCNCSAAILCSATAATDE